MKHTNEEIEMIRNFVLGAINKNMVVVLGTEELIDKFSFTFGTSVDIVMIDFSDQQGNIEAKPIRTYNSKTKEINVLGMANKKEVIKIIKMGRMKRHFEDEDILENLILVELEKSKDKFGNDKYDVNTRTAKTEKDKIEVINKIFRNPEDDIRKDIEKAIFKEKSKHKDEYIGYV